MNYDLCPLLLLFSGNAVKETKKNTTEKVKKVMGTRKKMSIQVVRNYLLRAFKHSLQIRSHQFISLSLLESMGFSI